MPIDFTAAFGRDEMALIGVRVEWRTLHVMLINELLRENAPCANPLSFS